MSPDKIQTISNWPEPRKVKDIQSFFGFANFYHWFIFNYNIVVPLTQLTQKDAPWIFSKGCWCAFNALKHTFTTAPILIHLIQDTSIIVKTDASHYVVTGILSIICFDEEIHLVVFYSWTLTALELNYNTHNQELLTIFDKNNYNYKILCKYPFPALANPNAFALASVNNAITNILESMYVIFLFSRPYYCTNHD